MDERSWGVRPAAVSIPAGAAVLAAVWVVLARTAEDRLVAGVLTLVLLGVAAAAFRLRVRLTAGPDGFVLRRLSGAQPVAWTEVVAMSAPTRRRRGLTTTTLEFDLADESLIVLGRLDLGTDPEQVLADLRALRAQQPRK